MPTLMQQVQLATNATFGSRLTAAGAAVAMEVLAEPVATRGNPSRRSMASGVLGTPDGYTMRLAVAVVTDPAAYASQVVDPDGEGVPEARTDTDADAALVSRLRSVWSLLAGVPPVPEG